MPPHLPAISQWPQVIKLKEVIKDAKGKVVKLKCSPFEQWSKLWVVGLGDDWAVLSDEQMRKIWQFSLLNDEQMSNKVEVKHQPDENLPSYVGIIINHYKDLLRIPMKQPGFNGKASGRCFFVAHLDFESWDLKAGYLEIQKKPATRWAPNPSF